MKFSKRKDGSTQVEADQKAPNSGRLKNETATPGKGSRSDEQTHKDPRTGERKPTRPD